MTGEAIIVGAGIWGCTVARQLGEAGHRVHVYEKRSGIGGNCRCETDAETGIEVHVYGSHIFHTHNTTVWNFVRRFTEFNGYQHKVLASYRGKTYHLPLGLTLVNKFFGVELKPSELNAFLKDESRSQALFDAFFRGYTSKQWGQPPEEIDPSIIKRVPARDNYDTNYFNDYLQGIPSDGYNALFERLLNHPNITTETNADISLADIRRWTERGTPVYYSGPIDALFGFSFGALPWRTLRFETEKLNTRDFQGTSVVNYTEAAVPFTRIHEFKHYHPEQTAIMSAEQTIICREYPKAWALGDEPYYPVNTPDAAALLRQYQTEAARIPNLVVGGRLGSFRYYDMDLAMEAALRVVAERLA